MGHVRLFEHFGLMVANPIIILLENTTFRKFQVLVDVSYVMAGVKVMRNKIYECTLAACFGQR